MKRIFALALSLVMSMSFTSAFAQTEGTDYNDRAEIAQQKKDEEIIRRKELRIGTGQERASLSENSVTVSGTVSLPDGKALADSNIYLYFTPASDNFIDAGNWSQYYAAAQISEGRSSGEYSVEVPAGNYIIEVYSNGYCENTILGTGYYRNGTTVSDVARAEVVTVDKASDIDIALPEAAASISGTITLTNPPQQDGYIYVRAYTYTVNNDIDFRINTRNRIPVTKGQTKVDYTVGAAAGSTYVNVYGNNLTSAYFSLSDTLSYDTSQRRYFDTRTNSYENINYIYKNVSDTEEEEYGFELDVTLNEPVEDFAYIDVDLYDSDWNYIDYSYAELEAGESTAKMQFPALDTDVYILVYVDDMYGYSSYFYNEEYGIAGSEDLATLVAADTEKVSMVFPETYTVSGSISRNGVLEGTGIAVTAWIVFDEDYYSTEVYMNAGENSVDYSLEIPVYLKGQSAGAVASIGDVDGEWQDVTFDGDKTLNLTLGEDSVVTVNGVFKLTKPAPEGGVGICISNGYIYNYYYIPEGETDVEYNAALLNGENYTDGNVYWAYIDMYSDSIAYTGYIDVELDAVDFSNNVDEVEVVEYTTVKGKVSVPEGAELNNGISLRVTAVTEDGNVRTNCSIYGSETECEYELWVPEGATVSSAYCQVNDAAGSNIIANKVTYPENNIAVGDGLDGINFELSAGNARFEVKSLGFVNGRLTAEVEVERDAEYEIYPVYVWAEYDSEGRLVNTWEWTASELYGGNGAETVNVINSEARQNGNKYMFTIWNNLSAMKPLVDAVETK